MNLHTWCIRGMWELGLSRRNYMRCCTCLNNWSLVSTQNFRNFQPSPFATLYAHSPLCVQSLRVQSLRRHSELHTSVFIGRHIIWKKCLIALILYKNNWCMSFGPWPPYSIHNGTVKSLIFFVLQFVCEY